MKLLEIIATPQTKSITPKVVDQNEILPIRASFGKATQKGKVDYLGGGAFANVYQHKKRPGTVLKVGVIGSSGVDGYVLFLNTIFHNERMQSNPYFPKVYNIKTYQVRPNRTEYVVEMERLYELMNAEPEEIYSIGDRLFKDYETLREAFLDEYRKTDYFTGNFEERDILAGLISRVVQRKISISHIQDKKFREALALIGNITKRTQHFSDTHSGNFMIRRTSVGPQLVITDPLV